MKKKDLSKKNPAPVSELSLNMTEPSHFNNPPAHFQPDVLKRDLVRQTIITILWRKEELTMDTLVKELKSEIGDQFSGDIEWYAALVTTDLQARKLMETVPGKQAVHYRLTQKLDKKEDD